MNNGQLRSKATTSDLSFFGGPPLFTSPISTSNLVKPELQRFLDYSKIFFDQKRYTNDGPLVRQLEQRLAIFHDVDFCIGFANGFWAIVASIHSMKLSGRNEVIIPSLTYRRLADVVSWAGLVPNFCEVDYVSLAISPESVRGLINERTALILAPHPIVNTCDVVALEEVSRDAEIPLLFDSVESVYETVGGKKTGSFGGAECFSMHASKLINSFEGGYVTTNNEDLANSLKRIRGFGFWGVDNIERLGFNGKLNEIHAAMALASLDDLEDQINRNKSRYLLYRSGLNKIEGIRLLEFDESEKTSYKNIVIELLEAWPLSRGLTLDILQKEGAIARPYYSPPLHHKEYLYPVIKNLLPVTDNLADKFLLLPCGHFVCDEEIVALLDLLKFLKNNASKIKQIANFE
jgi:dTDP-4-amino-4,6-dideoxygalactose transaminase